MGLKITSESIPCDRILEDGELIMLGKQTWEVLITPGHCPGHVCLMSDAGLVAGGYGCWNRDHSDPPT